MFIRNDNNGRYYNGRIGHITHVDNEKIYVLCPGEDEEFEIEVETWENTKYTLNEKTKQIEAEVQGTLGSIHCVWRGQLPYIRAKDLPLNMLL